MAQTGSSSEKNTTTDTNIEEVNGDVADPSNKNTMDQTPQNSIMKPIEESKTTTEKKDEDKLIRRKKRLAESWFIIEYRRQYCQQHRVPWLPKGEVKEARKKFHQMVEENPKIVEEYYRSSNAHLSELCKRLWIMVIHQARTPRIRLLSIFITDM